MCAEMDCSRKPFSANICSGVIIAPLQTDWNPPGYQHCTMILKCNYTTEPADLAFKKIAKLGDVMAISKSETMNH